MNAIALRVVTFIVGLVGVCIAIPIMLGFLVYDAIFGRKPESERTKCG